VSGRTPFREHAPFWHKSVLLLSFAAAAAAGFVTAPLLLHRLLRRFDRVWPIH
jgi:hypothetical protein